MRGCSLLWVAACVATVACQGSRGSRGRSDGGGSGGDPGIGYTGPLGDGAYWLENTSRKVQPTTAPGEAGGTIVLEGPRASVESYQIVVRPTGGGMRNVNATASALTMANGEATIGANHVTLFREFFIDFGDTDMDANLGGVTPVPASSPTADARIPDPLVPLVDPYSGQPAGAPFDVQPETNQPLWVDVAIPGGAVPGTYQGTIEITADEQDPLVVPIELTVWDLTLPDSSHVTTYFKIDWSDVNGFHAGMDTAYPNDHPETKDYVKRYEELAHVHRANSRPTWVPYPNGCTPPTDWTDFDAVLGPYLDGSYFDDGVPATYFGVGIPVGDPDQPCTHDEYVAVGRAWAEHLKAQGWFDQSWVYAADEPSPDLYPVIAEQAGWLQEADPDWKRQIIDTTAPRTGNASLLVPALGVFVLCLKCYDSWELMDDPNDPDAHVYGRAEWPDLLAQGTRMWFYESIAQGPPYPGFATNTLDAAEPRITMWGSWYEGATGFLYYSMTQWERDQPWGPNISFPKTGDGVLLYPGNHDGESAPAGSPANIAIDGPIPSLRLKMVRTGMQDWALFQLAAENGLGDVARTEVARAYNQLGGCEWSGCNSPEWYWNTDYTVLAAARRAVAEALVAAGVP